MTNISYINDDLPKKSFSSLLKRAQEHGFAPNLEEITESLGRKIEYTTSSNKPIGYYTADNPLILSIHDHGVLFLVRYTLSALLATLILHPKSEEIHVVCNIDDLDIHLVHSNNNRLEDIPKLSRVLLGAGATNVAFRITNGDTERTRRRLRLNQE